jgi:hypothetical protein
MKYLLDTNIVSMRDPLRYAQAANRLLCRTSSLLQPQFDTDLCY